MRTLDVFLKNGTHYISPMFYDFGLNTFSESFGYTPINTPWYTHNKVMVGYSVSHGCYSTKNTLKISIQYTYGVGLPFHSNSDIGVYV